MKNYVKSIFIKLTIALTILALGGTIFYLMIDYSFTKSFQIAVLTAFSVGISATLFFSILFFLISPLLEKIEREKAENREEDEHKAEDDKCEEDHLAKEQHYVKPKEDRIVHHNSKEEYSQHTQHEMSEVIETQKRLKELATIQGVHSEIMLILPLDLSFLLAKGSIENLTFGKIKMGDDETGVIVGRAGFGFGSSPQEIKLTLQMITNNVTSIYIISRSTTAKQSDRKNNLYIDKISNYLKEKEKFYTE
ncbi:MAG: hypothetical protein U9R27_01345 [Campylobacterota bacterium]|nr:hypothetical protein [Campylobacterota bacterium]